MADPKNPLTARVMTNRLWHHVFGRGIVATVDNFGAQGALPTHPALLDYLALRFVEQGWSVKALLREMVLSRAFRRASQSPEGLGDVDPQNLLLSHYPVRRLEAESIRDGILAASGQLDRTLFGPPVPIHLTQFMKGRGRPETSGPLDGQGRRSLYISVRRNFLSPMLLAFDKPIPFSTFGRRNSSNVPAQSLTMLNDPFVASQAEAWGAALVELPHATIQERISYIYMRAVSRQPSLDEVAQGRTYLETLAQDMGLVYRSHSWTMLPLWAAYCHVIFNLKEFILPDLMTNPHRLKCRMTRREMLSLCRNGFGGVALMGLMGSCTLWPNPWIGCHAGAAASQPVSSCAQGAKRHFPLHGRRRVPGRQLRPQATSWRASTVKIRMISSRSMPRNSTASERFSRALGTSIATESAAWRSVISFRTLGAAQMIWQSIRSMVADFPEHTNANYFLHTGHGLQGRPSMGSWVTYGLGSENQDLPGYVVLDGGLIPPGGLDNFNSGFLPASYQGSIFRAGDEPLANIDPLEPVHTMQRRKLALINKADDTLLGRIGNADQIESAVSNYELAFRMQASVPELTDLSTESEATRKLYGMDSEFEHTRSYAAQCLLARRLVERGVRFVELTCPRVAADRWDQHARLIDGHTANAFAVDQPHRRAPEGP